MRKLLLKTLFPVFIILLFSWFSFAEPLTSAQKERDEIYILTAYAVVLNDWQDGGPNKRGHNIGSILVDPKGNIVRWARNCNARLNNGTQHGEVRLIIGYLNENCVSYLKGYTIYTTLEPCAQCSGMMALTQTSRTVYGQTDPGYGKAIERLALNSKKWNTAGYKAYPRTDRLISDRSSSEFCGLLEKAYSGSKLSSMTGFLLTKEAKDIYQRAFDKLMSFKVKYPENQKVLDHARAYLKDEVHKGIPVITLGAHQFSTKPAPPKLYAGNEKQVKKHIIYGIPLGGSNNKLIARHIYCLSNNAETKFADWVAYRLDKETVSGASISERNWKNDPDLGRHESLEKGDYTGAAKAIGIEKGHQAPLAAFKGTPHWRETNVFSNCTPQKADLNGEAWERLEHRVRKKAEKEVIYVITGTLYEREMVKLPNADEPHQIPSGYFKIIAKKNRGDLPLKVTGYIFDQCTRKDAEVNDHKVSVNEIEERSGFDFFWELPDDVEEEIESQNTLHI